MIEQKIKPPIGTVNTGYEYKVAVKPPFGEALVAELRKILGVSGKKNVKIDAGGKELNASDD